MLYSRFLLVIYSKYSSVYMSVLNSKSISPPNLFPVVTINLFSKSVSLFLLCKYVHLYHFFLDSAYKGIWASPVAQLAKNQSAIQETWVWSLGWEDPLEESKATYSSVPAWRIPWTKEPGRLWSTVLQRVGYDWSYLARTHEHHKVNRTASIQLLD